MKKLPIIPLVVLTVLHFLPTASFAEGYGTCEDLQHVARTYAASAQSGQMSPEDAFCYFVHYIEHIHPEIHKKAEKEAASK